MLKVGIVGTGLRGMFFAEGILRNPQTELAAMCDSNHETLQKAVRKYPVPAYVDYQEMLKKESLDLVCVLTPDFAHKDIVIAAAEKKIHIFVEKPLAMSLSDCEKMEYAVEKNQVNLTVAFTNRWNPPFKRAKEIIDRGELGDILSINAKLNNAITIPTKMIRWSALTSPAWFLMSHPLDLALWYTKKKVVKVYAQGYKKVLCSMGIDTWDGIHSAITFEDGATAVFESCWVLPEGMPKIVDYKYGIVGTKASIDLNMQDQMIHFSDDKKMTYPDTFAIDLHGDLFAHNIVCFDSFIDSIKNDTPPIVSLEEAKENVAIIEAVHRSLESGEPEYLK